MFKDIVLLGFKFSGVDFIEDLKKHENIEENGVMFASLIVPIGDSY